ncbi:hypothetical protein [Pseudonocardia humida]|uniref:Excreted virulence factor EspC (Type VII ESX diderm) n=1 Tax=Pseudonocardia humida TaxID=2800819 RepID=A0ABT0ZXZ7_9PSEU|nr:hypothetical protein [Pseudonocardia humida]MCO1655563.1 hypothetical protein [Pseudonocardia humida]
MSTATDQFTDLTTRTQEAVGTAVRTWAETVQSLTGNLAEGRVALPDAQGIVSRYFDVAQQVLDTQRRFAETFVAAGTQATEAVTEQAARAAQSVVTHTANATETVTDKAAEATKDAGEKLANGARTTRNAAKA